MIIEVGTKLRVHSDRRGDFLAVARRSFSTEDKTYPLTVVDPMNSKCALHEEVNPLAFQTYLEPMDVEIGEPQLDIKEPEIPPTGFVQPVVYNPSATEGDATI